MPWTTLDILWMLHSQLRRFNVSANVFVCAYSHGVSSCGCRGRFKKVSMLAYLPLAKLSDRRLDRHTSIRFWRARTRFGVFFSFEFSASATASLTVANDRSLENRPYRAYGGWPGSFLPMVPT